MSIAPVPSMHPTATEGLDLPALEELFSVPGADSQADIREESVAVARGRKASPAVVRGERMRERIREIWARNPALKPIEALRMLRSDPDLADCKYDALLRQVKLVYGRNIKGKQWRRVSKDEAKEMKCAIKSIIDQMKQGGESINKREIWRRLQRDYHVKRSLHAVEPRIDAVLKVENPGEQKYKRLSPEQRERVKEYLGRHSDLLARPPIEVRDNLVEEGLLPPVLGVWDYVTPVKGFMDELRGGAVRVALEESKQKIKAHLTEILTKKDKTYTCKQLQRKLFKHGLIPHANYNAKLIKTLMEDVRSEHVDRNAAC